MTEGQYVAVLVEVTRGRQQRHPLTAHTTLGRGDDNHIRLEDGAVSAHHAVVWRRSNDQYLLEDLGTTNGTFVGGKVVKRYALRDGDTITVGGIELNFRLEGALGTPTPEATSRNAMTSSRPRHAVKVTISDAIAAVRSTWEMPVARHRGIGADGTSGDVQRDNERLRAGYQVIHAIVGEDDLEVILNTIVDSVIDLISADRAAILIADTEGKLAPRTALQRHASGEAFNVPSSILSYVVEHRAAVVCDDLGQDSRFSSSKSIIAHSLRSAMCVPMLHEGELVGVLHLDSSTATTTFRQESLEVVSTIANAAAYAVKVAMLKEQIHQMERKRAEAMLAMISGASHFINNPLSVIRSNLSMFTEWSNTMLQFHREAQADPGQFDQLHSQLGIAFIDEELGSMATDTNRSAARIEEIVSALRMFEHQHDPGAWTTFDVAALLGELMAQQQAQIAQVAQTHCQLSSANVYGIRERLQLLFSNLLINARQAIDPGAPGSNWVVASCHVAGEHVIVSIDDTGRGVPAEQRHRVFAPFNTQKLDGALGLGLAVAAEIARQHGASLQLKPREGGGTRLVLQIALAS